MYKKSIVVCQLTILAVLLTLSSCAPPNSEKSASLPSSAVEAHQTEGTNRSKDGTKPMAKVVVSYSLAKSQLTLHEPVILNFTVENRPAQPIKLDLGQDRKGGFSFTIKRPDGSDVQLPQFRKEGIARIGKLSLEKGQTYTQKLLLNEWFDFAAPGKYEIAVRLTNPIQTQEGMNVTEATEFRAAMQIEPRDAKQLKQVCAGLVNQINNSTSYEEAAEAALTLSYIKDSVAVPYLKEALVSGHMVEPIAVAGLERIGGNEAVEALTSALKTQRQDTVDELIRPALIRIKGETKHTSQE
jgi:curli biogenesis system outer membrane secretion channel CsgG